MNYSKPCQMLVDEHEVIVSVIEAVEVVAQKPDGTTFSHEFYERACDFFSTFADKCHHAKEEVHLFPMLEERGIPRQGGPIGCMLHEHDEGRAHIAAIREALRTVQEGKLSSRDVARNEALSYCGLLRQHIQKENQVLFVIGDQAMSSEDQDLLVERFSGAEHDLPPGTHEKYLAVAGDLRKHAGLGPTAPGTSCSAATGFHSCHGS